jgi:hypothetical protein
MSTTYTTLNDLVDREIVPALDGVEDSFDVDMLVKILRDQNAIRWTGIGFELVTDEEGNTPGFWAYVQAVDLYAARHHKSFAEADAEAKGIIATFTGADTLEELAAAWKRSKADERAAYAWLVGGIIASAAQGESESEIQRVTSVSRPSIRKYLGKA